MEIQEDSVIINLSGAQRRIFRDQRYAPYFEGASLSVHGSSRPQIFVDQASRLIARLRDLQTVIIDDPEYKGGAPAAVLDRIILRIEDAIAAHARAYGTNKSDHSRPN
jgi:hypothetical protein